MNQRIRLLDKQAQEYAAMEVAVTVAQAQSGRNAEFDRLYRNKFAELIIQESIEVMMKNDYHGEWLGEKVKEHFGVEE